MKKLSSEQIRNMWISFYEKKKHVLIPSVSLIPFEDPSLLWINSGVAGLKKYFDGSEVPPSKRLVNVQKAIRTSDIENVGYTPRHHTFFEMLGNFSIGDYFRDEMLMYAIELLTSEEYYGLPLNKLYFTYLPSDTKTYQTWMKYGVESDHLIPLESNYWEIGEGPSGPNTEVFYDRGEKYDPEGKGISLLKEDLENDRYVELWGIVFSQFNAVSGVKREDYEELPSKNIDTGLGLERLACVLQDKETNFETDLFLPIIEKLSSLTKKPYIESNYIAFRVIVDHVRSVVFALSDGEMFSNEGRGYVLRRLLRRAMRFGRTLGMEQPFLYELVDVVENVMGSFYKELSSSLALVKRSIKSEEEKFIKTLRSGESILRELLEANKHLSGEDAFRLYDTYGFPIELTLEIAKENNVDVNLDEFHTLMKKQKERARSARQDVNSLSMQHKDLLNFFNESTFHYFQKELNSEVVGLFINGEKVNEISDEGEIIFKETNFYAESGGQIADLGHIQGENFEARVLNTLKAPHGQHLHFVKLKYGSIKVNDHATLIINLKRRLATMRNHSATHLLHLALGEVLGKHVKQQGSFVSDQYLRFDFSHFEKVSDEQLKLIEKRVNELISLSLEAEIKILPIKEAEKLNAKAFFDEKYLDDVRVVSFGGLSLEYCGGTHVESSDQIGLFAIEFEEAIASGIRRIQARTSFGAYELLKKRERLLEDVQKSLKAQSYIEIKDRLKAHFDEMKKIKEENNILNEKLALSLVSQLKKEVVSIKSYQVISKYLPDTNRELLMRLGDYLKSSLKDYVICLIGGHEGNLPIVCFVSDQAIKNGLKAKDLVSEMSRLLNGSGGGRDNLASGLGKNKEHLDQVFTYLKKSL